MPYSGRNPRRQIAFLAIAFVMVILLLLVLGMAG
jgi:hypothetical protein